jgi:hypothetical protein
VALGLILSIGLAGFIGSRAATAAWRTRSDREAIGSLVTNWGNKIMGSDYDGAYALCSPRFHQHVSKQKFTDFWTYVRDKAPYGNVAKVEWNEQAGFETQRDTGLKLGYSIIILTFAKNPEPSRQEAIFAQEPGGTWQIESLPNIFPPEQPKK